MALVHKIKPKTKSRHRVHEKTICHVSDFTVDDKRYIQLDTIGSDTRKVKDVTSQTIQFDKATAIQLKILIEKIFHL